MFFKHKQTNNMGTDDVLERLPGLIKENEQYIIDCRRTVHRFAEVGGTEVKTSAFVRKEAEALGLPVEEVSQTGLIVTLDTGRKGNGVVLRSELDALPIPENPNNMKGPRCVVSDDPETSHTCGHDAHVGMLLGAMRALVKVKDQLSGRIYFCFEEGEENGLGWCGMADALERKDVNTVFALHVSSRLDSGLISVDPGPRLAGTEEIDAVFIGKGGHASRPDLSVNPVYAAASAVCDLAVAFTNQIDPNDPVTLGITSISGGNASNTFPDTAHVIGGMRFFSIEAGKHAANIVKTVFSLSGKMHNCKVQFNPSMSVFLPPTINDEDASAFAERVFTGILPEGTVVSADKWFGSESFSQYLERYKGVYAFLGTRNEELGTTAEHHNEYFDVDESVLSRGALCYAAYAVSAAADSRISQWKMREASDITQDEDEEERKISKELAASSVHKDARYNLDTKIGAVLKSKKAVETIEAIVPGVVTHPQAKYFSGMTLRRAARMLPDLFTPELLSQIDEALSQIDDQN